MSPYLTFRAGQKARSIIREHGFTPSIVKVVAGAAGGPKWLILGHMDKLLFSSWFAHRTDPLFMVGSSAGAWRFAALSQNDPAKALDRLKEAYIGQWYRSNPTEEEISSECDKIMKSFLDEDSINEILNHPYKRLNILAVRSKGLVRSSRKGIQGLGLTAAAVANIASRNNLKYFFERTLFYTPGDKPPFYNMNQFPIQRIALNKNNLKKAVLSSGSIPMVMRGVEDIQDAPEGVYRDGGAIDYHPDLPFTGKDNEKIVLFPHYTDRIIPGWLDKKLSWRMPCRSNMDNVLLISPSEKFIKTLPNGKLPDRDDFIQYKGKNTRRINNWNLAVQKSRILAEELWEVIETGRINDLIKPDL